ncbi:glycine cleavage system T protein [Meredithblackwellia eburnea MCA 4105]
MMLSRSLILRSRVQSTTRLLSTSSSLANSRTPLYNLHVKPEYNGKMVEFAGFDMPLSYQGKVGDKVAGGPVAEHHQVRKSSGLFDVGHMVQSTFTGPGAHAFLSNLLPASLASLPSPKSASEPYGSTLSVLLNPEGGIIDDCMITRWGDESFYLVTNAGRAERDIAWIKDNISKWNDTHASAEQVTFEILSNWGLIALQGPSSHSALQRLLPSTAPSLSTLTFSHSLHLTLPSLPSSPTIHIARGGYTGEDGFEISIPASGGDGGGDTEVLAEMLLDQPEVKLAGLAARDSLRLEAGLCLYGHDLDEGTGVGEAGLGWVVGKDRRTPGSFIGSERTLAELKKGGTTRKRVGLVVEKGPPAREGARILAQDGSTEIGVVTSGLPSPTLGQNISMGYISTEAGGGGLNKKGSQVLVEVRKKLRKAEVVGMPWIQTGYFRG